MDPREVAPLLGLSAGSVSALAYRAREGLRRSWLQAHVNTAGVPAECRWAVEQMGDYNRGALSARQKDRFEEHLTGCLSCSILVEEVDQVASRLGLLLVPLVLGVPAVLGGGSFALGGAASAAPVGAFVGPTAELASPAPAGSGGASGGPGPLGAATSGAGATGGGFSSGLVLALVGAGVAVATGVLVVAQPWAAAPPAVAEQLAAQGDSPGSADGATTVIPGTTDPADIPDSGAAEPPATGTPEAGAGPSGGAASSGSSGTNLSPPPGTQVGPEAPVVPAPPVVTEPPDPVDPVDPVDPADVPPVAPTLVAPAPGELVFLPELSGTGEAGATVTLSGTDLSGASSVLATADVSPAGTWRATPSGSGGGWDSLTVTQERGGLTSEPTTVQGPFTFALPSILTPADGSVLSWAPSVDVRIEGRAGLTLQVFVDGDATGNLHGATGRPLDRVVSGLEPGEHSIGLRYVRATGGSVVEAGPTVTSRFTITG